MIVILFILLIIIALLSYFFSFPVALKMIVRLPRTLYYFIIDTFKNIKNKEYQYCKESGIIGFGGLFGKGKTLNAVRYVYSLKKRYKNVRVISNVHIEGIDYEPLTCYEDLLISPNDDKECIVYLCDEFGSLFNSRNFNNTVLTETQYIATLNQLRHDNKLLVVIAQRYGMLDKMFRQVMDTWYECNKFLRIFWAFAYDPYDLEYCNDPRLVKPKAFFPLMFIRTNKLSRLYNTRANVKPIGHSITITDRHDSSSNVSTDYSYSPNSKKKFVHKSNRKFF